MSVLDNRIVTHALIFTDDASHNTPSYIYAKQYDKNSRYINIKLMSADGQVVVSTPTKLNVTKPDGNTLYVSGTAESDGTVTFKIAASMIDQIGVVSCDVTVLDGLTQESVLLTSSTFYITVDKTNYDSDAPEGSDDYTTTARAGDLATTVVEGETILHLVDTNGDAMGHGVPFGGGSGVQSDWDQNDSSAPDFIKHKPTIPAAITVDTTVTPVGTNPVSGSGIYSAIQEAIQDAQFDYNNYVDIGLIAPYGQDDVQLFSISSSTYDEIEASYNTRSDSTVLFRIGASNPTYYLVHKATNVLFEGSSFLGYVGVAANGNSYDSGTVIVGFSRSFCVLHFEYIAKAADNAYTAANLYTDGVFEDAEHTSNKTTSISSSSTDLQYPSAKAVYDALSAVGSGIYEMQPFVSTVKMTDTQYAVTYKAIDKRMFAEHSSGLHIIKFNMTVNNVAQNFYGFSNGLQTSGATYFVITGVTVNGDGAGAVPFIAKFNVNFSDLTADDGGIITIDSNSGGGSSGINLEIVNLGSVTCTAQSGYYTYSCTIAQSNEIYDLWDATSNNGNLVVTANALLTENGTTTYLYLFAGKSKLETIDGSQFMTFSGISSSKETLNPLQFIMAMPYEANSGTGRIYFIDNVDTVPSAHSTTDGAAAAKTATCTNYILTAKAYVHVLFKNANTSHSALTLNINNTGAKPIYINGIATSSTNCTLPAGTYIAYYDGTKYQFRTDGQLPGKILSATNADQVPWTGIQNRPDLSHVYVGTLDGANALFVENV